MQATGYTIDMYIERLKSLTADLPVEDRFWVALEGDELRDMEDMLCESDERDTFYDTLISLYGEWRAELTDEQWDDVIRRNREMGGANMNWLIEEIW